MECGDTRPQTSERGAASWAIRRLGIPWGSTYSPALTTYLGKSPSIDSIQDPTPSSSPAACSSTDPAPESRTQVLRAAMRLRAHHMRMVSYVPEWSPCAAASSWEGFDSDPSLGAWKDKHNTLITNYVRFVFVVQELSGLSFLGSRL